MAKRFTETEKWKDPWFSNLTNDEKIVWLFLLDDCNHAGIWQVNLRRLNFECRTNYTLNELTNFLQYRICVLSEEKWFIPKFISFQYPKFPNGSPAIKSAIKLLDKEGLIEHNENGSVSLIKELNLDLIKEMVEDMDKGFDRVIKGLDKGLESVKDMDMDKDMEMDMDKSLDKSLDKEMEMEDELWTWTKVIENGKG